MTSVRFKRSRQRDAPVSHSVAPETVATTKTELVLADTMCQLQSGKRDWSIGERLEALHRSVPGIDAPMILPDDVVQVLARAHFDMAPSDVLHAQFPQCCAAGTVPVEGDGTREAMAVRGQCLASECR